MISPYIYPGIPSKYNTNADSIIRAVCEHFEITFDGIHRKSKIVEFCKPRMVAMYLIRLYCKSTTTEIAKLFNKNHATVIWAIKRIKEEQEIYPELREKINKLKKIIENSI